jgi:hypothetical protein
MLNGMIVLIYTSVFINKNVILVLFNVYYLKKSKGIKK